MYFFTYLNHLKIVLDTADAVNIADVSFVTTVAATDIVTLATATLILLLLMLLLLLLQLP